MFRVTHPSNTQLETLLETARHAGPTYTDVGATRDPALRPAGYRHDELECTITSPSAFDRARDGLRTWQAQIGAGADVYPRVFGPGETVIVYMGVAPFYMLAPCRLIYVIDDSDRFGFAYGTLPGHPEEGEEAFVVERVATSSVRFVIRAFSRPGDPLVKLFAPAARIVQTRMVMRYQHALKRYVEAGPKCS